MSGGVDKLIVLSPSIKDVFHDLARKQGIRKWGYGHVLDLRQTDHKLPIILYCDGMNDGRHKLEVVGVSRLGLRRTRKLLKKVLGHLSKARIYRIDLCVDLLGISVWDLAAIFSVSSAQNYRIYRKRGAVSFYVQNSTDKTIVLYDKAREQLAKGNIWANMLQPGDDLTRVEVRLTGRAVPFKKINHLHRYADINFLANVRFRRLAPLSKHTKPLHILAAGFLRDQISSFGLQAVKRQFTPQHWAYIEKILFQAVQGDEVPDIRRLMSKAVDDWLNDRVRFPSPLFARASQSDGRN